ncbi:3-keto-disaccharide hydrolase [Haloferula sp.]|uniref:3-keto-disaccharide hydrolase n=1 Tax=Haloferula sp. TaxID=2497595 RepID=UPI003C736C38
MKPTTAILVLATCVTTASAQENKNPKLPSGWRVHDMDRPLPKIITPGDSPSDAPSDAIILFDGTNLDAWVGRKTADNPEGKAQWKIEDGYTEVAAVGNIQTKRRFGDLQIHLEWATPTIINEDAQRRGNSGIYLMGLYEIQIMDAYENPAYPDGMAGAVYGQTPALVNASKKPGEWQTYDIIFKSPRFEGQKMVSPPTVTVIHNGVVVQNNTEILGSTNHNRLPTVKAHAPKAPITLQDHGQPVRYRNIWVREL